MSEKRIKTDVLVIGGGLAGCFAAVRAKELNADVTLVEKNYVGKSGCSHYARDIMVFREEWGDSMEEWLQQFAQLGEYIADQSWDKIILRESYPRFRNLVDWGESFFKKDGTVGFPEPEEEPLRYHLRKTKYRRTSVLTKFVARHKMLIARKKVTDSGCNILDRIMITDLIMNDGRVAGAAGFHTRTGEIYIIEAKATIISSGGLSFRSARYGRQFNAGEGMTMGYRAGAELTGMEFGQGMYVVKECDTVVINGPVAEIGKKRDQVTNANGEEFLNEVPHVPINILWPIEIHKGRGPIYHEPYGVDREKYKEELKKYDETAEGPWITMLDRAGLDIFNDRFEQYMAFDGTFYAGGLRINTDCATNVPGLYAAGDAAGTNYTGTTYVALGSGLAGASVMGYRAGQEAAEFARKVKGVKIGEPEVEKYRQIVYGPLDRKGGFSPDHVLMRIQQTIFPYEVRMVMHEKRLQAAITMIEFFKEHFQPKLRATDPHDLRKAHEVRSMILGAEIMLRTALYRTESRGWFYREDYPRRDDKNWLKWVFVKKEDEKMKIWAEPVPKEYQGDTSMPYEVRYPLQYQEE